MLKRLALIAAAVGVAALTASPAYAAMEIPINPGNVPVLAVDADHECDFGGGPIAGQDVWVFVLPGKHETSGDFISVTAFFDSDGNGTPDKKIHIDADGGGFANGGPDTSKAFIALPAGWKLLSATAEITGTAEFFNLTHTCVFTSPKPSHSPKPSPTASASASASPSASASSSASASPSESASASPSQTPTTPSQTPSTPTSPSASPSGGLPITGTAAASLAVFAVVLIAAGAFAVLVSRRRRFAGDEFSGKDEEV